MSISGKYKILTLSVVLLGLVVLGFLYSKPLWQKISPYYHLFSDREQIKTLITSFGLGAPAVFITVQILQVLFAPIPGEATGFIGGYLFGAAKGFLYSSIGLTAGSWMNFRIGRFLGRRYVRKLIPADQLDRLDTIIRRQGIIVIFMLFVFPGFPKDYFCLFLGLSALPISVLIILATIGRMPGTFMLCLQGAFLYEKVYGLFAGVMGVCIVFVFFAYWYRENLYQWIEKLNNRS